MYRRCWILLLPRLSPRPVGALALCQSDAAGSDCDPARAVALVNGVLAA